MATKVEMLLVARNIDFGNELLFLKTQYYYDGKVSESTDIVFNSFFLQIFLHICIWEDNALLSKLCSRPAFDKTGELSQNDIMTKSRMNPKVDEYSSKAKSDRRTGEIENDHS